MIADNEEELISTASEKTSYATVSWSSWKTKRGSRIQWRRME